MRLLSRLLCSKFPSGNPVSFNNGTFPRFIYLTGDGQAEWRGGGRRVPQIYKSRAHIICNSFTRCTGPRRYLLLIVLSFKIYYIPYFPTLPINCIVLGCVYVCQSGLVCVVCALGERIPTN